MLKKPPGLLEKSFAVLTLWFATTDLLNLLILGGTAGQGYQEGSNQMQQLLFFVIYAICVVLLLLDWRQVLQKLAKRDKLIWVVMALVVASMLWSPAPDITQRRAIALVGTTLIGVYLSTRYTLKQQFHLLCWAWGLAAIMSFVFALGLPKYGIMGGVHAGAWRGIFLHKNIMGRAMSWGVILFLLLAMKGGTARTIALPMIGLCALLIAAAKSSTAVVALVTMLVLLPLMRTLRLKSRLMVVVISILSLGVGVASSYLLTHTEVILGALNKDVTLTGRTDMWPFVWEMIEKRPWFGYGYEGFWRGLDSDAAYVWRASGWRAPHSHNGFLELMLIFGAVGTTIFLINFAITFWRSLRLIRVTRTPEFFMPTLFLIFTLLSSITETGGLLDYNNVYWVMYTMVVLAKPEVNDTIASQPAAAVSEAQEPVPLAAASGTRPAGS